MKKKLLTGRNMSPIGVCPIIFEGTCFDSSGAFFVIFYFSSPVGPLSENPAFLTVPTDDLVTSVFFSVCRAKSSVKDNKENPHYSVTTLSLKGVHQLSVWLLSKTIEGFYIKVKGRKV